MEDGGASCAGKVTFEAILFAAPMMKLGKAGEVGNVAGKTGEVGKVSKALNKFGDVSIFLKKNKKLPDNFITKKEARKLGWDPRKGNLDEIAPGKSIGGDIFHNKDKLLPDSPNRIWYEADINYTSGFRGSERILYSNDGLIYKTTDRYKTFIKLND